jgi:hypothetical protein
MIQLRRNVTLSCADAPAAASRVTASTALAVKNLTMRIVFSFIEG